MEIYRSWLVLILLLVGLSASSCNTAPEENSETSANDVTVSDEQNNPAQPSAIEPPPAAAEQQSDTPLVIVLSKKPDKEPNPFNESMRALGKLQADYGNRLNFIFVESSENPSEKLASLQARGGDIAKFLKENEETNIAVAVFNSDAKKLVDPGVAGTKAEKEYREHFDAALLAAGNSNQSVLRDNAANRVDRRSKDLEGTLSKLEQKQSEFSRTLEEFPFNSLGSLLVIAMGVFILLALILAGWNTLQVSRQNEHLARLKNAVSSIAKTKPAAPVVSPPINQTNSRSLEEVEGLRHQIQQVQERIRINFDQNGTRLTESEGRLREALIALREMARWVGERQMSDVGAARGAADENARRAVISEITPFTEEAHRLSDRVEPLRLAMRDLVENLSIRGQASGDIGERLQMLYRRVSVFDQLRRNLSEELKSAQTNAAGERLAQLEAERQRLAQTPPDQVPLPLLIKQYRELYEKFIAANQDGAKPSRPTISRNEIQERIEGADDELMNWFDDFYQLLSQVKTLHDAGALFDADLLRDITQVQRTAREVLNRFDIQPEEILVGRTNFDRRLHDAALVRQSSQYPTNTVIEVQRSGFRRASDGQVLRRPQVVVAGTAV